MEDQLNREDPELRHQISKDERAGDIKGEIEVGGMTQWINALASQVW